VEHKNRLAGAAAFYRADISVGFHPFRFWTW